MKNDTFIEYLDTAMLPCYIGFTSVEKKFKREMKRLGIDDYGKSYLKDSRACATTWELTKGGVTTIIVCMSQEREPDDNRLIGLVAHEALHTLDHIVAACREESKADEFRAYIIQWLVQKFLLIYKDEWEEAKKAKRKKKK